MVQERVFTPLGMAESSLPLTAANLSSDAPTGYSATGIAEAPWAINGWAPAGGVCSTAGVLIEGFGMVLTFLAVGVTLLLSIALLIPRPRAASVALSEP